MCMYSLYDFQKCLVSAAVILCVLLFSSCDARDITENSSDVLSDEYTGSVESSERSEASFDAEEPLCLQIALSTEDLPEAPESMLVTKTVYAYDNDTLAHFIYSYRGSFPAIADIICTEDDCYVLAVYCNNFSGEDQEECCEVQYCYVRVDTENRTFGEIVTEAPAEYTYDKNTYNQNGYFWLDYEEAENSDVRPYVVMYRENDTDRTLFFEEGNTSYIRIIRQNDQYAVLSLTDGSNRSYYVINKDGKTIAKMDWIADISMISPLMFDDTMLYCKMDSDEDYVYDTIGAIELESGTYQEIKHIGNYAHWTYTADGGSIIVYNNGQNDPTEVILYLTSEEKLITVPFDHPIKTVSVSASSLCGVLGGDSSYAFLWDSSTQRLFVSEAFSSDCIFSFGDTFFCALDGQSVTLYSLKITK